MSETTDINKITVTEGRRRRNPRMSGRLAWNKIMGIKIGDKITPASEMTRQWKTLPIRRHIPSSDSEIAMDDSSTTGRFHVRISDYSGRILPLEAFTECGFC